MLLEHDFGVWVREKLGFLLNKKFQTQNQNFLTNFFFLFIIIIFYLSQFEFIIVIVVVIIIIIILHVGSTTN